MGDDMCKVKIVSVKQKTYDLVPPDAGWGYFIAVAATITFTTTTCFKGCFGILFNDFIVDTKMSSAAVTILAGINYLSIALAGFFASALLKIMSRRKLALFASVIHSCGCFGTVVMKTPFLFFIAMIFDGAGLGLHFNLSCTIINDYFLNKHVLIMNFVQAAIGVFTMVSPLLVKWSIDEFGVRGTLLLITGVSLQNFIAVALMQPVKWHLKKIEVPEKEILLESDAFNTNKPAVKPLETEKNKEKLPIPELAPVRNERSRIRTVFKSLIDPSVFKSFAPSCASYGPAMCNVCDAVYLVMLPAYLYSIGWRQERVAMSITLFAFGDLATRIILTLISKWLQKVSIQGIYIVGITVAIVSRLGTFWTSNVIVLMVCFTLMGVAHCSIAVLMPLVITDTVPADKFSSAMGICMLFHGLAYIVFGPVVGAVRDLTSSYTNAFYVLVSFYTVIAAIWTTELTMNKQRRNLKKSRSESVQ